MSDVLVASIYRLPLDPKPWQAMEPYAPLATLIAASVLRAAGHQVALFDATLSASDQEWEAALDRERPRITVLHDDHFNYLSKMCLLRMREAAFAMVRAARERGCAVAVCSADAADHPALYLERGADFVVHGEGEDALVELLGSVVGSDGRSLDRIAGLSYRGEAGPARTPPRPPRRDLDGLPLPAWDLADVERYRTLWRSRHGFFSMNLATSRGCPFRCNWCAKPIWGRAYHARSPESVAAEIRWLHEHHRPDHLWFMDDIFALQPGWLERFAARVVAEGPRLPFKCLGRADLLLRDGCIQSLRRAGCTCVWIGAESGSQRILDAMEKQTRVEQVEESARRLHQAGIQVGLFVQFGYPGETRDDIERTRRMLRRVRPDDIGVSVSYPLPGTSLHERVRSQLGERRNWFASDDLAMLYEGPFPTAFYRELHALVHAEQRRRRGWAELRGAMHSPSSLRPRHLRHAASLAASLARTPLRRALLEWAARGPRAPGRPDAAAGMTR